MNLATVAAPGVIYITTNGITHYLFVLLCEKDKRGYHVVHIFHIGVGSSVVCSSVSGNAKASISGTDNKKVPTLFNVRKNLNLKLKAEYGDY